MTHLLIPGQSGRDIITVDKLRITRIRHLWNESVGDLIDISRLFLLPDCEEGEKCLEVLHWAAWNTSRKPATHCRNGHEYEDEDVTPDGLHHRCQKCRRARLKGGKAQWELQKLREFCPHGHAYTPENTYTYPTPAGGTRRLCRTCVAARGAGIDPATVAEKETTP